MHRVPGGGSVPVPHMQGEEWMDRTSINARQGYQNNLDKNSWNNCSLCRALAR